ncbi:hypothetical protein ACFWFR_15785, partial [Oerskovia sp. NPDC060287]|uniref:hypothetical protein n=1 Tax=Oerskovia sp. NPDC060287 TaxID=3347095 RepID=UPI0036461DFC
MVDYLSTTDEASSSTPRQMVTDAARRGQTCGAAVERGGAGPRCVARRSVRDVGDPDLPVDVPADVD